MGWAAPAPAAIALCLRVSRELVKAAVAALIIGAVLSTAEQHPEPFAAAAAPSHPRLKRSTDGCQSEPITTHTITSDPTALFDYSTEQFKLCLSNDVLIENLEVLVEEPFPPEYFQIMKEKVDQFYPSGIPEEQLRRLGSLSRLYTGQEISQWSVTSNDTLSALLSSSGGDWDDSQMQQLLSRYLALGGTLTGPLLQEIGGKHLCNLQEEQLEQIPAVAVGAAAHLDISSCSQTKKDQLYSKARVAFAGLASTPSKYYCQIRPYLGGAPAKDLKDLANAGVAIDMDMETFLALNPEELQKLSVTDVKNLLGENLPELKKAENEPLVRSWVERQSQRELDCVLRIGLKGGMEDTGTTTPAHPTTPAGVTSTVPTTLSTVPTSSHPTTTAGVTSTVPIPPHPTTTAPVTSTVPIPPHPTTTAPVTSTVPIPPHPTTTAPVTSTVPTPPHPTTTAPVTSTVPIPPHPTTTAPVTSTVPIPPHPTTTAPVTSTATVPTPIATTSPPTTQSSTVPHKTPTPSALSPTSPNNTPPHTGSPPVTSTAHPTVTTGPITPCSTHQSATPNQATPSPVTLLPTTLAPVSPSATSASSIPVPAVTSRATTSTSVGTNPAGTTPSTPLVPVNPTAPGGTTHNTVTLSTHSAPSTPVPNPSSAPTATPVPNATSAPTATPVPNATSAPTATHVPKPTSAPTVTAVPNPTSAPTATPIPSSTTSTQKGIVSSTPKTTTLPCHTSAPLGSPSPSSTTTSSEATKPSPGVVPESPRPTSNGYINLQPEPDSGSRLCPCLLPLLALTVGTSLLQGLL